MREVAGCPRLCPQRIGLRAAAPLDRTECWVILQACSPRRKPAAPDPLSCTKNRSQEPGVVSIPLNGGYRQRLLPGVVRDVGATTLPITLPHRNHIVFLVADLRRGIAPRFAAAASR